MSPAGNERKAIFKDERTVYLLEELQGSLAISGKLHGYVLMTTIFTCWWRPLTHRSKSWAFISVHLRYNRRHSGSAICTGPIKPSDRQGQYLLNQRYFTGTGKK